MKNEKLAAAGLEIGLSPGLIAVRLDGVGFSKVTKDACFDAPFDMDFVSAMDAAATAVMRDAGGPGVFAYTQSDEITAVFDLARTDWYSGRAFKIASLCAGLTSSVFAAHLNDANKRPARPIMFDARIVPIGCDVSVLSDLIDWRLMDSAINSTTTWARHHLGHAGVQSKTTRMMREELFAHDVPWGKLPASIKFGRFIVRESYTQRGVERHHWVVRDAQPTTRIESGLDGPVVKGLS